MTDVENQGFTLEEERHKRGLKKDEEELCSADFEISV